MLGFPCGLGKVGTQLRRQQLLDDVRVGIELGLLWWHFWRCWDCGQQVAPAFVWLYPTLADGGSRGVADQHLTDARSMLKHRDPGRGWSQHDQLAVPGGISRQYKMDRARLHTSGGTKGNAADGGFCSSDVGEDPMHTQCRSGRAAAVVLIIEEEQQRVTTPLEEVGTFVLGVAQQPPEYGVEDVTELLRTFPTAAGQPLGKGSEAANVEQQQAAVDDSVGRAQLSCGPSGQQPRHICHRGRAPP